jgi:hypothetical protein
MKFTGENRSTGGKTCPSATLSTRNPTWTDQFFSFLQVMEHRWNEIDGENRSTREKTCPSATLSTTNPTRTDQFFSFLQVMEHRWYEIDRYNNIQTCGTPTCFGLFRPSSGRYSTFVELSGTSVVYPPEDGRERPKHVGLPRFCILLLRELATNARCACIDKAWLFGNKQNWNCSLLL